MIITGISNNIGSNDNNNRRKSNITLSIDPPIFEELKKEAESEGLSVNAKINAILTKHVIFYRHSEEYESVIIPGKIFSSMVEMIDEQKFLELLNRFSVEVMPSIFTHNGIEMNLDNLVKHGFETIVLWTGMYQRFLYYTDNEGYLDLIFDHNYGLKWSRIMGTSFCNFIENVLKYQTKSQILPTQVVIRVDNR